MNTDIAATSTTERSMEKKVATLFGLEGDAWMRHANRRSVWTRFTCVSLIAVAVWSRDWIGWYCAIPIALATMWMMVNPRLFGVPSSTRNWASKAVFGERIWSDRTSVEIPDQFRSRVPNLANAYSSVDPTTPAGSTGRKPRRRPDPGSLRRAFRSWISCGSLRRASRSLWQCAVDAARTGSHQHGLDESARRSGCCGSRGRDRSGRRGVSANG